MPHQPGTILPRSPAAAKTERAAGALRPVQRQQHRQQRPAFQAARAGAGRLRASINKGAPMRAHHLLLPTLLMMLPAALVSACRRGSADSSSGLAAEDLLANGVTAPASATTDDSVDAKSVLAQ